MHDDIQKNIKKNLANIKQSVLEYSTKRGIACDDVTLVAISKYFPAEYILAAFEQGQVSFGESRAQELVSKQEIIKKDIDWHFIGHLQTNKVKYILNRVKLLHSLDSLKLAKEIDFQCGKIDSKMDVLLQVNISKENTKFGIFEEEIYEFIEAVSKLKNVHVKGLMTMAPFTQDERVIADTFRSLRKRFDDLLNQDLPNNIEMRYISMGMSKDYKIAIQEGSNMIRIGSDIFGKRT
jgi:PLP dependent protein